MVEVALHSHHGNIWHRRCFSGDTTREQDRTLQALSSQRLHDLTNLGQKVDDLTSILNLGISDDKFGLNLGVPI